MSIRVVEISGRKALRRFVQFQLDLYRGVEGFVPPMFDSQLDGLDPEKNPAFEFCEVRLFMAYDGERPLGRIAGIINHHFNQKAGRPECRFSYCDFVDDPQVSQALLQAVESWGRSQGMVSMVGPLGMTDMDTEGCLVEGFEHLATFISGYNFDYYQRHFEAYGLQKDATWNEYRMPVPEAVPAKHQRVAEVVRQRYGLRALKFTDAKVLVARYGHRLFDLLNQAYAPLYGVSELTEKQIDYYIDLYLPQLRLDLIRLIVDQDDNLLAFGIACPSLSRAQQKAQGRMLPFGWWHLARTMYLTRTSLLGRLLRGGTDTVDLMLIAVRPDLQGKGINSLLFTELIPQFIANGYKYVESTHELETNVKVQNLWGEFHPVRHKRFHTFRKEINIRDIKGW